jgi:hypothetical protein
MCISCGCGRPNDNHGDQRNITLQDIDAAAEAAGTTREKILQNISGEGQRYMRSQASTGQRPEEGDMYDRPGDGYRDTEGAGYGQSQNSYARPEGTIPAQQGYDPAHSGARQSHKEPGKRVESPGRETGIAWGEDQQMGYTTDTPDRKNPAE